MVSCTDKLGLGPSLALQKILFKRKLISYIDQKQLIENIRQDIQTENFESLKSVIDELKLAMKNMADENLSANDGMGDLNDL